MSVRLNSFPLAVLKQADLIFLGNILGHFRELQLMIKPNLNSGFGHVRLGDIGQPVKCQRVHSEDLILVPLVTPRFPVDIFDHQARLDTGILLGP